MVDFAGFNPQYYHNCLGPAWFNAFAVDLVRRLPAKPPSDVLELACGTGMATRPLRDRLDPTVRLAATDLSRAMLDFARSNLVDSRGIEWREADASSVPFKNGEFGAVVCAFGIMFVADKRVAMREARRVLKKGGILLFNVWDRIDKNPHAAACAEVLEDLFPGDEELRFRAPYEMHDPSLLRRLLAESGFEEVQIEQKQVQVRGVSARSIAIGQIRGTPRSLLIEKRGVPLDDVVERVSVALAKVGGADPYSGVASAVVVEARAVG